MNRKFIFGIFVLGILLTTAFVSAGLFSKNRITGQVVVGADGWTEWLDRDNPGGTGDWETFASFKRSGEVCDNPTAIECETTSGEDYASTGDKVTCTVEDGLKCKTWENSGGCEDYRVRFYCGNDYSGDTSTGTSIDSDDSYVCGVSKDGTTNCEYGGITYEVKRPWGNCNVQLTFGGYGRGLTLNPLDNDTLASGIIMQNVGTACTDDPLKLKFMPDDDDGSSCSGTTCTLYSGDALVFEGHTISLYEINSYGVSITVDLNNQHPVLEGETRQVDLDLTTREIDGDMTLEIISYDKEASRVTFKITVGGTTSTTETGVSVTSPDGTAWICGVSNTGLWSCSRA